MASRLSSYGICGITAFAMMASCQGLSPPEQQPFATSRQAFLARTGASLTAGILATTAIPVEPSNAAGGGGADLSFRTAASGLQWADARVGTGKPLETGTTATIDYVMSTTGARYGTKIFKTADLDQPYRWTLGDGTTIAGIEQAILGTSDGVDPMRPGGIRRIVIPQSLGYTKLAENSRDLCVENGSPGPIPPPTLAFEEYQRFKNIYCNPSRQYQPDVVLDIKLYGQR